MVFPMLKNAFLYRIALYEPKKRLYRETKSFFVSRKLYELHSKPLSYAQKLLLYVPFFAIRKKFPFSQTKSFSFAKSYTNCPQKPPFLRTKSLLFAQTFPCCYPKLLFSTLSSPFQPTLTYCPQKFPVFTNQKPFFRTNLFIATQSNPFPPSAFHSNHP